MRTWSVNFVDAGNGFLESERRDRSGRCAGRGACSTAAQCRLTETLIEEHNEQHEVTPELDAQFAALAAERIRERPLHYYVVLPLWRVADMWLWPRTERFR